MKLGLLVTGNYFSDLIKTLIRQKYSKHDKNYHRQSAVSSQLQLLKTIQNQLLTIMKYFYKISVPTTN
jgi:hypothetical protein